MHSFILLWLGHGVCLIHIGFFLPFVFAATEASHNSNNQEDERRPCNDNFHDVLFEPVFSRIWWDSVFAWSVANRSVFCLVLGIIWYDWLNRVWCSRCLIILVCECTNDVRCIIYLWLRAVSQLSVVVPNWSNVEVRVNFCNSNLNVGLLELIIRSHVKYDIMILEEDSSKLPGSLSSVVWLEYSPVTSVRIITHLRSWYKETFRRNNKLIPKAWLWIRYFIYQVLITWDFWKNGITRLIPFAIPIVWWTLNISIR